MHPQKAIAGYVDDAVENPLIIGLRASVRERELAPVRWICAFISQKSSAMAAFWPPWNHSRIKAQEDRE
ncbi:hypothetical protein EBE87_18160 [Pseudoroseomonas wenyumeiae]|uniref:Uncharacterized protein n=1 Tax=Teichococcus wenyumeiae TaxID=2478470 RepID=A0A3A9K3N9_9PROT|nr:hypothetical protein [Pseudoroseomonas wenyumeiae]RKK05979.1 hypothetical protein D6Z83_01730 [Pseudoroseomonas wenyumeiae]RMI19799.1 hypothetical protein EBE87_18160 [Pseudoroseomonas wenyumeiae]